MSFLNFPNHGGQFICSPLYMKCIIFQPQMKCFFLRNRRIKLSTNFSVFPIFYNSLNQSSECCNIVIITLEALFSIYFECKSSLQFFKLFHFNDYNFYGFSIFWIFDGADFYSPSRRKILKKEKKKSFKVSSAQNKEEKLEKIVSTF